MVRADDHALAGGRAARQQLMAAVPAGVREGVQHAVVVPGQQHAADSRRLGPLVAGVGYLVAAADAQPAAAEEMPLFPLEHRGIGIGGAGEHPALAELAERLGKGGRVQGSGRRTVLAHTGLTDHTVNARRYASGCLASGSRWYRPKSRSPAAESLRDSTAIPGPDASVARCPRA